jgi:alanine dehydrogenase
MKEKMVIGLPRMQVEWGERRDFLPEFAATLERYGAQVMLEHGYGAGMGYQEANYLKLAPNVLFAPHETVYEQECVMVIRCPGEADLQRMQPGATLISMLHYPTRPVRTEMIRSLGIEAISLDSIKDDNGRRLIENLQAVAWNGLEVAFQILQRFLPPPGFFSPERKPIQVTQLGSGAVGMHVMQAAIRYGSPELWSTMLKLGTPGVQVTVVDFDTTRRGDLMRPILERTDILVDATQRPDPSQPVIYNEWIGWMPEHAVLLDLSVDPYQCDSTQFSVKGIEGIPQGDLDRYVFLPDDPAYNRIPECIPTENRRISISCYSWPGIHAKPCMEVYGTQLRPIMRTLIEKEGVSHINHSGRYFERAIGRALLSRWEPTHNNRNHNQQMR